MGSNQSNEVFYIKTSADPGSIKLLGEAEAIVNLKKYIVLLLTTYTNYL